jgi:hypothetical protein
VASLPKNGAWEDLGKTFLYTRAREALSFLVDAAGRHVELHLRARDRLVLRLNCEAVLLEIAGGEIAADAGQHLAHRADVKLKQKGRQTAAPCNACAALSSCASRADLSRRGRWRRAGERRGAGWLLFR